MAIEEEFYDSLEEEDEEKEQQRFVFSTPPNTSRFLNGYDNLEPGESLKTPSVSPVEDMDRLASAFQQLRLEDPQQSPRTSVRRSKSCTSLGSGTGTRKKKKKRRSKCDSYLEMYHRRKSVVVKAVRPSLVTMRRSVDLAPPPTTRTFYEEEASTAGATYDHVRDLRAFPSMDVKQFLSVSSSDDGGAAEWRRGASSTATSSGTSTSRTTVVARRSASYVPYSLKDYRALQVPRLGSLGPDWEAVRDKYERMRRQRAYGMQASVRNRSKMATAKPPPAAASTPPKPPPDNEEEEKMQQQQQQPKESTTARKPRPLVVATKKKVDKAPNTCDLQPLVDRHMKEMQASAVIRQHFKCL